MSRHEVDPHAFLFSRALSQPETLQFLFLVFGIVLVVGIASLTKKITHQPTPMSQIAFASFYFVGPFISLLGVWLRLNAPWLSSISWIEVFIMRIQAWLLVMPQFFLLILIGCRKFIPWRFSFSKFLREARSSVFVAAPFTWRISIFSYAIFVLGTVYTLWLFEVFNG
jgi:hypothetical protein